MPKLTLLEDVKGAVSNFPIDKRLFVVQAYCPNDSLVKSGWSDTIYGANTHAVAMQVADDFLRHDSHWINKDTDRLVRIVPRRNQICP